MSDERIRCPQCKTSALEDFSFLGDIVNLDSFISELECTRCGCQFMVEGDIQIRKYTIKKKQEEQR
jgi:DNA-directed RNA polymerase subunit RPC12/RpoP